MFHTVLSFVYPRKCILCRRIIASQHDCYFCEKCYQKLHSELMGYRKVEKLDVLSMMTDEEGMNREETTCIMGMFPLLPYRNEYRKAVMRWKYAGIRCYANAFAQLIVDETDFFHLLKIDALIPVPLSPSRMRKRGFNQALDLSEAISKKTGIMTLNCLERIRNTKPQSACSREERFKNIKDSIKCNLDEEKMTDNINSVAIIDDIYTTGSTAYECCKALEKLFVFRNIKVYILVVSSGKF